MLRTRESSGDTAGARAAIDALLSRRARFLFGRQHLYIARVLAILGEVEPAMTALRGAFARGQCYGIELHTDADLALLAGHGAFRELLRPKG